jgi:hypothetical protein
MAPPAPAQDEGAHMAARAVGALPLPAVQSKKCAAAPAPLAKAAGSAKAAAVKSAAAGAAKSAAAAAPGKAAKAAVGENAAKIPAPVPDPAAAEV